MSAYRYKILGLVASAITTSLLLFVSASQAKGQVICGGGQSWIDGRYECVGDPFTGYSCDDTRVTKWEPCAWYGPICGLIGRSYITTCTVSGGGSSCSDTINVIDNSSSNCSVYTVGGGGTCSDGIQNQDETGVDCGGICLACGGGSSGGGSSSGGGVPAGQCEASCYTGADCSGGLICHGNGPPGSGIAGVCRNNSCRNNSTCNCSNNSCNTSCSDYCAGASECAGRGGNQVGSRCSGGSCSPGTSPCFVSCPCSCNSWTNRGCGGEPGGGSCAIGKRRQTRDCNPNKCRKESRCRADAACVPAGSLTITPDPINTTIDGAATATIDITITDGSNITGVTADTSDNTVATAGAPISTGPTTYASLITGESPTSPPPNPGPPAYWITNVNAEVTTDSNRTIRGNARVNVIQSQCEQPRPKDPPFVQCAPDIVTGGTVTWGWDLIPNATDYQLEVIDDLGATVYDSGMQPEAFFDTPCPNTGNSDLCFTTPNLPPGVTYFSRISTQGICSFVSSDLATSPPAPVDSCSFDIGGTGVFLDDDNQAVCSGSPSRCDLPSGPDIPTNTGASRISLEQPPGVEIASVNVAADGTFPNFTVPPGTYLAKLIIGDVADWFCSAPSDCINGTTIGPDDNTLKYYVASAREAWYQIIGGDIHANEPSFDPATPSIQSFIPFTCDPVAGCDPFLILTDDVGTPNSSGIASFNTGTLDLSRNAGNQLTPVDQDGLNRVAQTNFTDPKETYDYFYRLFQFPLSPTDDFSADNIQKADLDGPDNSNGAYYRDGNAVIDSTWNIGAAQSAVIFVTGDLTIQGAATKINVAPGGFLAFIVRGSINVAPEVGHADPTDTSPDISGIFITDGTINIQSTGTGDDKFVGDGSFIGWGGVNLGRDFDSVSNNTYPVEVFRYRPDFVVNAPLEMQRSYFRWLEVAP